MTLPLLKVANKKYISKFQQVTISTRDHDTKWMDKVKEEIIEQSKLRASQVEAYFVSPMRDPFQYQT